MNVPALPDGFWVADFRIEVPVEKGWLATRGKIDGFNDEAAQHKVGERVAMLRSGPAFGHRFVEFVQRPLVIALKELRASDRDLFDRMNGQVSEVAVEVDSLLDPSEARVTLLTEAKVDQDVDEWWHNWWDEARETSAAGDLTLHAFSTRRVSEVSLAEYRRMTTVPLTRLSPE